MSMLTHCDCIDWSGYDSAPESTLKTPDVLKTCASALYLDRDYIDRYELASSEAGLPAVHGTQ